MKLYKRTYFFLINEIRYLRRAPLRVFLAFIIPVAAWICLALTYQTSTVQNLPFIVVDHDNSSMSRMAARYLDATGYLKLYNTVSNENIAFDEFRKMNVYFIVTIPKGFQEKIKTGTGSEVPVIANGYTLMYAKVGYKGIAQALSTISAGVTIKRLEAKGYTPTGATAKAAPIGTEIHSVGNPYLDYSIYLIPGMVLSLLQMSASFSALWLFRTHRESSKGRVTPRPKYMIPFLVGRLTPITLLGILASAVVYLIILPLAHVPLNSSVFDMFLLTVLYMFVSMGLGALVSILYGNLISAAQALLIINAPAFVFSGYTFPHWAMPNWAQSISQLIPLTHFLDGFFPMFLFNTSTMNGVKPLLIMGGVLWGSTLILMLGFSRINQFRKLITKR
jgi:ABC-2 type transport system permease protein